MTTSPHSARSERRTGIPDSFWREVPCGHPPDPVAVLITDCGGCTGTHWVCHCGTTLDADEAISDGRAEGAPGPIVPCTNCGCAVALGQTGEEADRG